MWKWWKGEAEKGVKMPAPFSGDEEKGNGKWWKGAVVNSIQNLLNFVRTYPCLPSKFTFLFNLFIVEKMTLSRVIFTDKIY